METKKTMRIVRLMAAVMVLTGILIFKQAKENSIAKNIATTTQQASF